MSDHYHDPNDSKLFKRLKGLAPEEFSAWLGLEKSIAREGGAIPPKYRQLISVAVAITTQCPYCIEAHARAAKKAGATAEELAEAGLIAAALNAGAAAAHATMALKFFEVEGATSST